MIVLVDVVTCYVAGPIKCVVLRPTLFSYRCLIRYSQGVRACYVRLIVLRVLASFFIHRPAFIKGYGFRFIPMGLYFYKARGQQGLQGFGLSSASRIIFRLLLLMSSLLQVK